MFHMVNLVHMINLVHMVFACSSHAFHRACPSSDIEKPEKARTSMGFEHVTIPQGNIRTHTWQAPRINGFIILKILML